MKRNHMCNSLGINFPDINNYYFCLSSSSFISRQNNDAAAVSVDIVAIISLGLSLLASDTNIKKLVANISIYSFFRFII